MKVLFTLMLLVITCIHVNAQIVYTDVKPDSVINGSYYLDLNNDGITDFVLHVSTTLLTCARQPAIRTTLTITPSNTSNAIIGDGLGYARALHYDSLVVKDSSWSDTAQFLFDDGNTCLSAVKGYWVNPAARDMYLGLRFTNNNNIYYGWARLSGAALKDYAYNSIAGQPIPAGLGASIIFPQTAPPIQWQKSLGGSSDDDAFSVKQTSDGGYIVAGTSYSSDGDVIGAVGGIHDYWVVKLNSNGTIQWQKSFAQTTNAGAYSIQQTFDGGYIVAGNSDNSGFITDNHGGYDGLIIKLDSIGNIQWQKSYGGSNDEVVNSIQQTADSGYIFTGSTLSNDGDVSGKHGDIDCWTVKLDSIGNIQWQKCLGGSGSDIANSIEQTTDGGYIVGGTTNSQDGDVTGWHPGIDVDGDTTHDYWVVKLNSNGTIQWQKCLGGSGDETAYSTQQSVDGGYVVAGWSDSNDGDVTGNHGGYDSWVVKLNNNGIIEWQESLGSSGSSEYASSVRQTADDGYVIAGNAEFNDGDVSGIHGGYDAWVVKLDSIGNPQWQKCLGGSDAEIANSIEQTNDGGYILAGNTNSNDYDVSGNHGGLDYWVVKLGVDSIVSLDLLSFTGVLENNVTKLSWQTSKEINTKDFIIERSSDGINFSAIGKVNAKNLSAITYSYNYSDDTPLQGTNYYRLKMEDNDGKFTYSNIVEVYFDKPYSVSVSPVPAHDVVSITGAENFTTVQFMDVSGRIVKQFAKMPDNIFPVADLSKGVYYIKLSSKNDSRLLKMLKE